MVSGSFCRFFDKSVGQSAWERYASHREGDTLRRSRWLDHVMLHSVGHKGLLFSEGQAREEVICKRKGETERETVTRPLMVPC